MEILKNKFEIDIISNTHNIYKINNWMDIQPILECDKKLRFVKTSIYNIAY